MTTTRDRRLVPSYGALPIKTHKAVKNCTELYMANQRMEKLTDFDAFVNLQVLWINGNQHIFYQLQELQGLSNCFRIKQLYAQNNCIRSLEKSSLPQLKYLHELRLYDNKLSDLEGTLKVLRRLSCLRDLDLFNNALVQEENYRLHVIQAIPSLHILDRHVITDDERLKASRLQRHGVSKKRTKRSNDMAVSSVSGTVKLLFNEVAAIKRAQQKRERLKAEKEQQALQQSQQQAVALSSSTHLKSRTMSSLHNVDTIPGLPDWEVSGLRKYFSSLEETKHSGLDHHKLALIVQYLRTRGYVVMHDGLQLDEKTDILKLLPASDQNILWNVFVQLFQSKQLQCVLLSPQALRHQAADCFEKSAVIHRRLQALNTDDTNSAHLLKDSFELSQQGYHLEALALEDNLSSTTHSKPPTPTNHKAPQASISGTRFYMTVFHRENPSSFPSMAASSDKRDVKFSELRAKGEPIMQPFAEKYKLQHKDFTKYLAKQSAEPTHFVRRHYPC